MPDSKLTFMSLDTPKCNIRHFPDLPLLHSMTSFLTRLVLATLQLQPFTIVLVCSYISGCMFLAYRIASSCNSARYERSYSPSTNRCLRRRRHCDCLARFDPCAVVSHSCTSKYKRITRGAVAIPKGRKSSGGKTSINVISAQVKPATFESQTQYRTFSRR